MFHFFVSSTFQNYHLYVFFLFIQKSLHVNVYQGFFFVFFLFPFDVVLLGHGCCGS